MGSSQPSIIVCKQLPSWGLVGVRVPGQVLGGELWEKLPS